MKIESFFVGLFIAVSLYIILPGVSILLSDYLSMPIIYLGLSQTLGIIVILIGIVFLIYLLKIFKVIGKGTPVVIEPTTKLIIIGPYKFVRNPMYLTHLFVFLGMFLYFGRILLLLYLILSWIAFHLFIVMWEEPQLKKRFGESYLDYIEKVPRWFPKLTL